MRQFRVLLLALTFCHNPGRAWVWGNGGWVPQCFSVREGLSSVHFSHPHSRAISASATPTMVIVSQQPEPMALPGPLPLPTLPWRLHTDIYFAPCDARQREIWGSHQVARGKGRHRSSLPWEFSHEVWVGEAGKQQQDLSSGTQQFLSCPFTLLPSSLPGVETLGVWGEGGAPSSKGLQLHL